jgi:hypothetical protein
MSKNTTLHSVLGRTIFKGKNALTQSTIKVNTNSGEPIVCMDTCYSDDQGTLSLWSSSQKPKSQFMH